MQAYLAHADTVLASTKEGAHLKPDLCRLTLTKEQISFLSLQKFGHRQSVPVTQRWGSAMASEVAGLNEGEETS